MIVVSSGSVALEVIMVALELGENDEVVMFIFIMIVCVVSVV